jgi:hypothetical protein
MTNIDTKSDAKVYETKFNAYPIVKCEQWIRINYINCNKFKRTDWTH